jgi:hypothetical protein
MYSIFKVRRPEETWRQTSGRILFTWSIINPNGPTVSCVGIRDSGSPGQVEIYYRWMHFLGGGSFVLGYVPADAEDFSAQLLEVLQYTFSQAPGRVTNGLPLVNCVPSFVTPPEYDAATVVSEEAALTLISSSYAFRCADWGREMYYLRKYGADFFGRAGEETRAGIEAMFKEPDLDESQRQFLELSKSTRAHLPTFQDWQPGQYASRPLSPDDAATWWNTVTTSEFGATCLSQLAHAWVGAIHQVKGLREPVETFETLRNFFESQRCFLWPEDWNSDSITAWMGLR